MHKGLQCLSFGKDVMMGVIVISTCIRQKCLLSYEECIPAVFLLWTDEIFIRAAQLIHHMRRISVTCAASADP